MGEDGWSREGGSQHELGGWEGEGGKGGGGNSSGFLGGGGGSGLLGQALRRLTGFL